MLNHLILYSAIASLTMAIAIIGYIVFDYIREFEKRPKTPKNRTFYFLVNGKPYYCKPKKKYVKHSYETGIAYESNDKAKPIEKWSKVRDQGIVEDK